LATAAAQTFVWSWSKIITEGSFLELFVPVPQAHYHSLDFMRSFRHAWLLVNEASHGLGHEPAPEKDKEKQDAAAWLFEDGQHASMDVEPGPILCLPLRPRSAPAVYGRNSPLGMSLPMCSAAAIVPSCRTTRGRDLTPVCAQVCQRSLSVEPVKSPSVQHLDSNNSMQLKERSRKHRASLLERPGSRRPSLAVGASDSNTTKVESSQGLVFQGSAACSAEVEQCNLRKPPSAAEDGSFAVDASAATSSRTDGLVASQAPMSVQQSLRGSSVGIAGTDLCSTDPARFGSSATKVAHSCAVGISSSSSSVGTSHIEGSSSAAHSVTGGIGKFPEEVDPTPRSTVGPLGKCTVQASPEAGESLSYAEDTFEDMSDAVSLPASPSYSAPRPTAKGSVASATDHSESGDCGKGREDSFQDVEVGFEEIVRRSTSTFQTVKLLQS